MSAQDFERKNMKSNYGSKSCCGNPNNGGVQANNPKIDNMDEEKGFIDNSAHAINRKKK